MSNLSFRQLVAPPVTATLAAVALTACATIDPRGALQATRDDLAGRHPGEIVWRRIDGDQAATARAEEILSAPLTPAAASELALLHNPALQATLEQLGIAQADLAQATRLANPGVTFASIEAGTDRQRTFTVAADIVDWLVQPLRRKVAAAELERARLEVGRAILDAVAEARRALVSFQAAEQTARRLGQIEEIERAAADYAEALYAAGNLTALERAEAEADWAEARAEVQRAGAEAARRREVVNLALGLAGTEAWSAEVGLPAPAGKPPDVAALEEEALAARFDLGAGRWAVETLDRALTLAKRTRWLPFGADLGVETEREVDGTRLTGPVIELRLPLFDTGKASVARLEAELARARWQLTALEVTARAEVRQAAADIVAAAEVYRLYRNDVLPLRQEIASRTLSEYNQMLVGTFDVLRARRHVIEIEQRSLEALADYWLARIDLERGIAGPLQNAAQDPAPVEGQASGSGDEIPYHHHHGAAPAVGDQEDGR